jgi:hypothetical protein
MGMIPISSRLIDRKFIFRVCPGLMGGVFRYGTPSKNLVKQARASGWTFLPSFHFT